MVYRPTTTTTTRTRRFSPVAAAAWYSQASREISIRCIDPQPLHLPVVDVFIGNIDHVVRGARPAPPRGLKGHHPHEECGEQHHTSTEWSIHPCTQQHVAYSKYTQQLGPVSTSEGGWRASISYCEAYSYMFSHPRRQSCPWWQGRSRVHWEARARAGRNIQSQTLRTKKVSLKWKCMSLHDAEYGNYVSMN